MRFQLRVQQQIVKRELSDCAASLRKEADKREMDKCSECKERKCWYVNISIVNIVKFNNININRLSHPFLLLILLNNRKISVKL